MSDSTRLTIDASRLAKLLELLDSEPKIDFSVLRMQAWSLAVSDLGPLREQIKLLVAECGQMVGRAPSLRAQCASIELPLVTRDLFAGALVHLVRNAVDHGGPDNIEISLRLGISGGDAFVELKDSGAGLDLASLQSAAMRRGLRKVEDGPLDVASALELIFAPEFSSLDQVRALSGRGVGLNAVRSSMREAGGDARAFLNVPSGLGFYLFLPVPFAAAWVRLEQREGSSYWMPAQEADPGAEYRFFRKCPPIWLNAKPPWLLKAIDLCPDGFLVSGLDAPSQQPLAALLMPKNV